MNDSTGCWLVKGLFVASIMDFVPLKFLRFGTNSCKVKVFGSTPSSQLLKDKNELCKKKKNFLDLEQKHFRWRYSLRVELWQH